MSLKAQTTHRNMRKHRESQTGYISIHERPKFINERQRISDREIDTVTGKAGYAVLLTVVDRLSRLVLIKKINHKETADVNQGLIDLLGAIPKEFVHSLVPDHGREFLSLNNIQERFKHLLARSIFTRGKRN